MNRSIRMHANEVDADEWGCVFSRRVAGHGAGRVRDRVVAALQSRQHGRVRPLFLSFEDQHAEFEVVSAAKLFARPADFFHDRADERELIALLQSGLHRRRTNHNAQYQ